MNHRTHNIPRTETGIVNPSSNRSVVGADILSTLSPYSCSTRTSGTFDLRYRIVCSCEVRVHFMPAVDLDSPLNCEDSLVSEDSRRLGLTSLTGRHPFPTLFVIRAVGDTQTNIVKVGTPETTQRASMTRHKDTVPNRDGSNYGADEGISCTTGGDL